jgi:phage-related protein
MDEAMEFLDTLSLAVREKIYYNAGKVAGGVIDNDLFKKLDGSDDIWEFRTKYNGMEYRLLAFWDEQEKRLVVATHGFVKKTWKVPQKEIARAEALRKKVLRFKIEVYYGNETDFAQEELKDRDLGPRWDTEA